MVADSRTKKRKTDEDKIKREHAENSDSIDTEDVETSVYAKISPKKEESLKTKEAPNGSSEIERSMNPEQDTEPRNQVIRSKVDKTKSNHTDTQMVTMRGELRDARQRTKFDTDIFSFEGFFYNTAYGEKCPGETQKTSSFRYMNDVMTGIHVYERCKLNVDFKHLKKGQEFDMIAKDFKTFCIEFYEKREPGEDQVVHSIPFEVTI